MKLLDVVQAIVDKEEVSANDIEDTIMFLVQCHILDDVRVLRRIVKNLKTELAYEDL